MAIFLSDRSKCEWRYNMKKSIIKGVILGIIFFIALFIINRIMNQGNTDMTAKMGRASLPMVFMGIDDIKYNALYGYTTLPDTANMKETITVLSQDRETNFYVQTYGENVSSIKYEVRSVDGERLIETNEVVDFIKKDSWIYGTLQLKDLIEENKEYGLTVILEKQNEQEIKYFTRIIWSEDLNVSEKLLFTKDFHQKTFDKEAAKDLTKYLESNSQGDNSTFHEVDIHSSLSQITWGDLTVEKVSEPIVNLTQIDNQTANISMKYVVLTKLENSTRSFYVEEFYRIRYTKERTYLLDYKRTMDEFFSGKAPVYKDNKIMLGITDEEVQFMESEDGKILAYVINNRLCSYNVTENKLAVLFSFYDKDNVDYRTICNHHAIKILDVEETGNVYFAVYGYMNRGRHEGEIGIQIYGYDSTLNTIEEKLYLKYDKTYAVLKKEMEELLYMNRDNQIFLKNGCTVYKVDAKSKKYTKVVQTTMDKNRLISKNNKVMVWQVGDEIYKCKELRLIDFKTEKEISIQTTSAEYILPLGFMGEDVIYGKAYIKDIVTEPSGRVIFPMHSVYIMNTQGDILKTYYQENYYITDCEIVENQIILSRVYRNEDGSYKEANPEHITNNLVAKEGKNKLNVIVTQEYEKQVQFILQSPIDTKSLKVLTPNEVLFEGDKSIGLPPDLEMQQFYVYGLEGLNSIFLDEANAVKAAYEISGSVLNTKGEYIWEKGNLATRNQIMAIKENEIPEGKTSLTVCLDTILRLEGVIRNSDYLLSKEESIYRILSENLENTQVLDLKGCNLESMLYYINQDIPVLAILNDGSAVLVIGFNEHNVVIMDPVKAKIYKKGIKDANQWFEENGNYFLTYIRL